MSLLFNFLNIAFFSSLNIFIIAAILKSLFAKSSIWGHSVSTDCFLLLHMGYSLLLAL